MGDVPLSVSFEVSLNASKTPAGTVTFSYPITATSTTALPFDPFGLNTQSLRYRHFFPTTIGKERSLGFDSLVRGDSITFSSWVSLSSSPFSVPSIPVAVTEVISHVRFGVAVGAE